MTRVLGILNLTRDSFSDGGKWIKPTAAIDHAVALVADGAWAIDVGAESTHPDAENIDAETEIARLAAVVPDLVARGMIVSVDTYKPQVMRVALGWGAGLINDVTGLRDPDAVAAVRESDCRLIVMHNRSAHARAQRRPSDPAAIVDEILVFFDERIRSLTAAGIDRARLILDPGMGFFLGSNAEVSFAVLRALPRLRGLGLPLLVSTSRKSFLGVAVGSPESPRPVGQRGAATLASELWTAWQGVEYIRTHDVRCLCDALRVLAYLQPAAPQR